METLSPTAPTLEQKAIVAQHRLLKDHHVALQQHQSAIKSIAARQAETAQRLSNLSKLEAEVGLIRMQMSDFITNDEFAAMGDRVSSLEQSRTREDAIESRQATMIHSTFAVSLLMLLVIGFCVALNGRVGTLEQMIINPSNYPGNAR